MSLDFKPVHEGLGFRANAPLEGPTSLQPAALYRDPFLESASKRAPQEPLWIAQSIPKLRLAVADSESRVKQKAIPDTAAGVVPLFYRLTAFAIDTFLISGVFIAALIFTAPSVRSLSFWINRPTLFLMTFVFIFVLQWSLITAQEILMSASIGKKIFKIEVNGSPFQILIRAVLFIPSLLTMGTGVVWAFFNPENLCWHDLASGVELKQK